MLFNLEDKIKKNGAAIGVWNIIPNSSVVELICKSGVDFIISDMEHGPYDLKDIELSQKVCSLNECSMMVRVPSLDLYTTQRVLDLGVGGIIFPQVKGFADCELATKLTQYPPQGLRGFNPFTRASNFGVGKTTSAGDKPWTSIIIESLQSVNELDKILEIENLKVIYMGAYDLSVALGCPGDMTNPELNKIIEQSVKKIRNKNKIAGAMALNDEGIKRLSHLGVNFIVMGVDTFLIASQLQDRQTKIRSLIKGI